MATCVLTSDCRVVGRTPHEPAAVRVHAVLDRAVLAEFAGSWLHAMLRDRLLDCSARIGSADAVSPSGSSSAADRPIVWTARPFEPFEADTISPNASRAEIFFLMLRTEAFNAPRSRTPLVSCATALDAEYVRHSLGVRLRWRGPKEERQGLSLGRALRTSLPTAAVVVSFAFVPDVGRSFIAEASSWLRARGVDAARRGLVLHYRAGRQRPGWRCEAGGGRRIANDEPLAREAFWNVFWRILSWEAAAEHGTALCAAGGGAASGPCEPRRRLAEWCESPPAADPPRPVEQRMLLLGGDAHYDREVYLRRMHSAGLLSRSMWSLSTPKQCDPSWLHTRPRYFSEPPAVPGDEATWRPFCSLFPKALDRPLEGEREASDKDMSYAPAALYARTRFSLVFESVVSTPGDQPCYTAFLTEKVLKPLARGHPFLLLCAARGAWDILRVFGFRSFEPLIPAAFEDANYTDFPCDTPDGPYATRVVNEIGRLQALPDAEWAPALAAAAHNRRHLICPKGFSATLQRAARNVLSFAATVAATATPADGAGTGRSRRGGGRGSGRRGRGGGQRGRARGGGTVSRGGGGRGGGGGGPSDGGSTSRVTIASPFDALPDTVSVCDEGDDGDGSAAALPVVGRYCRRTARACAHIAPLLREHAAKSEGRPPLVHREEGRHGAGFGAVLQEKAGLLFLGLATLRPVRLWTDAEVFNSASGGALFGPAGRVVQPVEGCLPPSVGFATSEACVSHLATLKSVLLPYRCVEMSVPHTPGSARWLPRLEDGEADKYINSLKEQRVWDRWHHARLRELNAADLFPNSTALAFFSPSVTLAFAKELLLPPSPRTPYEHTLAAAGVGAGEYSGPRCLVRHMMRRASPQVMRTVLAALAPTASTRRAPAGGQRAGALLVGVHIRRGDRAIYVECPTCVNQDDPDVKAAESADRIQPAQLEKQLRLVNRTVGRLRRALGRDVLVFGASDTQMGLEMMRHAFGDSSLLTVGGRAVHSTRTSTPTAPDAIKVAADFVALAMSDVLFAIGDSSFSGNAAAVHAGVVRVQGSAGGPLRHDEIKAIEASLL